MTDEIRPKGLSYMWLLATRGGDALLKDIRPECRPEHRRPLVARGLVTETPEGRSKRLSLTDAGWYYLGTHMTDSVQTASAALATNVLQGLLAALDRHLADRDCTLAEFFSPAPRTDAMRTDTEKTEPVSASADDLWLRLSRSWGELQYVDEGIPLETLRTAFADVPRERLDHALLAWQKDGKIVIYPYDDGERVTPEAKRAALTVNGRDLHVIYRK